MESGGITTSDLVLTVLDSEKKLKQENVPERKRETVAATPPESANRRENEGSKLPTGIAPWQRAEDAGGIAGITSCRREEEWERRRPTVAALVAVDVQQLAKNKTAGGDDSRRRL